MCHVGASHQWSRFDVAETVGQSFLLQGFEFFRGVETADGNVSGGRLQILTECQDLAAGVAEVFHHLADFLDGLNPDLAVTPCSAAFWIRNNDWLKEAPGRTSGYRLGTVSRL